MDRGTYDAALCLTMYLCNYRRLRLHRMAGGASAPHAADVVPVAMIGPGDRSLVTRHFATNRRDLRYEVLAPSSDSVATSTLLTREEHVLSGGREPEIMITYLYGAPSHAVDTLVVRQRDLRPEWETLRLADGIRHLVYEPTGVHLKIELKDSVPAERTRSTAQHAFAFNEMEAVMRSLPLAAGYRAILPLFSEIDEQVELDTITVVSGSGVGMGVHANTWTVRFADPAIVSMYEIDRATRKVLTQTVMGRRSGRKMRYVPEP